MNKLKMLRIVNPVLFISAVVQIVTGAGFAFHVFESSPRVFKMALEAHEYNGFLFAVLIITHLVLNWDWVKSQFFRKGVK
ncbi:MAG: DUF4405 domain-containing protein [Candidatus Omnitrophica bacterium]|nr:DUF4405 domain-containing protein [Candidatus Omnitrophota bacterium]